MTYDMFSYNACVDTSCVGTYINRVDVIFIPVLIIGMPLRLGFWLMLSFLSTLH